MKKYTAYLVLSALLLTAGLLALVGSIVVYGLPELLTNPLLTVARSLALFGAGSVALYGQRRAFEAAHAHRPGSRYVERP